MADSRLTMVVNLTTAAVTQYQNYDFNSLAIRGPASGSIAYGATSDGLYQLEYGDADPNETEIDCYLQTMKMAMQDYYQTNFLRGYLNYRATGDIVVTSTADGWENAYDELVTNNMWEDGTWHTDYVNIDTGAWGNQWGFKVANKAGCDMSVRSFNLVTAARKNAPVFSGVEGINNRIDPALLTYNARSGIGEMSECINMYVDNSKHAHRRKGYRLLTAGDFHSLWCGPQQNDVYVAADSGSYTAIYRVMPDGSGVGIRNGMHTGRIWWTWYNGRTYYSNGTDVGYIIGNTSYPWSLDAAHPSEPTIQKAYYAPPPGKFLCVAAGRFYMAEGDTVWYSEFGSPGRWRKAVSYFQLEGDITSMVSVGTGVYVSDGVRTYYVHLLMHYGHFYLQNTRVFNHGMIPGTASITDGTRILDGQQLKGTCAVWASTEGICVGDAQGLVKNITEHKLTYPTSTEGCGLVMAKHGETPGMPVLYIVSLQG